MGISTNKNKEITVIDHDTIKINNLPNQFLFRKSDLDGSKSKYACIATKQNNPNINFKSIQKIYEYKNFDIFDETFLNKQTFIISAVDNISTRQCIDNICSSEEKTLIDSGIFGTKAHTQMIIPHLTTCYNDIIDPEDNLEHIPPKS